MQDSEKQYSDVRIYTWKHTPTPLYIYGYGSSANFLSFHGLADWQSSSAISPSRTKFTIQFRHDKHIYDD